MEAYLQPTTDTPSQPMMASIKFKSGDKVFAKVRGYPYWPARVDACADETPNKVKYHVYFYGTAETAICKAEELAPYLENKDKYGKPLKRKGFNEGLQQIETEINGGVAVPFTFTESADDDPDPDNDNSPFIDDNSSNASVTGVLEKKKKSMTTVKRKRDSLDSTSEDAELKRKHPRLSLPSGQPSSNVGGQVQADGDSPNSKTKAVSRSGRKIKPKKFADEDDGGEEGEGVTVGNGVSSSTDLPSSAMNSGPPTDVAFNKARKSQGSSRLSIFSSHPSSDGSAKSVGDGHGGISFENPNRAILARALSGHYVKIKLDDERPTHFEDDRARQLWDAATARNAEKLKTQIELGEYLPETIKKQLEGKADLTDAQRKEMKKEEELSRKRGTLRWLKQEAHLLELDAQIRSSLSLAKADTARCLSLMEDMLGVNIDPLMLKKHPNIVETVKKLQKYIGNVSKWNLTDEEAEKFKASCDLIRSKATHMYHKFKKLFAVPAHKSFWDVFSQEVERFNEAVKHMSKDKMYALVVDPEKCSTFDDSDEEKESPRKRSVKNSKSKRPPSSLESLNGEELGEDEADLSS